MIHPFACGVAVLRSEKRRLVRPRPVVLRHGIMATNARFEIVLPSRAGAASQGTSRGTGTFCRRDNFRSFEIWENVMLKRSLMMSAAAVVLLVAPALAQTPTPPASSTPAAPSAQAPAAAPSTTTAKAEDGKPGFLAEQGKDQWLASKNLIGAKVGGPDNATVGSINDLLIEKSGNVVAAVIGVGGFLGIGSKNVAVPFKSLELSHNSDGTDKIAMRFSKEELQQAPDFKPLMPPPPKPPVAGGPGTTSRPGGPMGK